VLVEVYERYHDEDLIVKDNYDNACTVSRDVAFDFSSNVPVELDTFQINYTVKDHSGNTSKISRTVYVVDTISPVIQLKGSSSVNIPRWHTYTDSGYTLTDNYDKNPKLTTGGTFKNTQLPGSYFIQFTAVDQSGNKVTASRAVIVSDNISVEQQANPGDPYHVSIYPNPTGGKFSIEGIIPPGETARITLYDIYGRQVCLPGAGIGGGFFRKEADIRSESAGIYFLKIEMKDKTLVYKIGLVK
jgi:hypothetical protein